MKTFILRSIFFPRLDQETEPRFVIESLELLKSSIVGEKHIKTIFTAPDGSVVKCVTFNAIKTDLETYLLRKDRKKINILAS